MLILIQNEQPHSDYPDWTSNRICLSENISYFYESISRISTFISSICQWIEEVKYIWENKLGVPKRTQHF
jgi:hypothetical protein